MDAPPGLLTDLYELTMAAACVAGTRSERPATFSLFVRDLPPSRGYLVAAGLDRALAYLEASTSPTWPALTRTGVPRTGLPAA